MAGVGAHIPGWWLAGRCGATEARSLHTGGSTQPAQPGTSLQPASTGRPVHADPQCWPPFCVITNNLLDRPLSYLITRIRIAPSQQHCHNHCQNPSLHFKFSLFNPTFSIKVLRGISSWQQSSVLSIILSIAPSSSGEERCTRSWPRNHSGTQMDCRPRLCSHWRSRLPFEKCQPLTICIINVYLHRPKLSLYKSLGKMFRQ